MKDLFMMKQAHVFISGFVQGVGFRQFVKNSAKKHEVVGWVTNLPDGRVETLLQGSKENIEQVISACNQGPMLSDVTEVDVVWEEKKDEYHDFQIIL
jgi:acylphosphatase